MYYLHYLLNIRNQITLDKSKTVQNIQAIIVPIIAARIASSKYFI